MTPSKVGAVVTLAEPDRKDVAESETSVRSLEELYAACRDAPSGRLVRVHIEGPDGSVRLDFANFTPR